jgi:hypothetical protein
MAARKTIEELLAANAAERAEVLRKDEERKAKRRSVLLDKKSSNGERRAKIDKDDAAIDAELAELNVVVTPLDQV